MEVKNTYSWQKKFTDIHENLLQSPWCKQESNIPCISCVGYLNILKDVLFLFIVVFNTMVRLSAINNGLFCDYFVDECWDRFDLFVEVWMIASPVAPLFVGGLLRIFT